MFEENKILSDNKVKEVVIVKTLTEHKPEEID